MDVEPTSKNGNTQKYKIRERVVDKQDGVCNWQGHSITRRSIICKYHLGLACLPTQFLCPGNNYTEPLSRRVY